MSNPVNKKVYIIGNKYSDCTLLEEIESIRCYCGKEFISILNALALGKTKSCGCRRKRVFTEMVTKHGFSRTVEYSSWTNLKSRCNNKNNPEYYCYGGRGIVVCDRWNNSFSNFLEDMGNKPTKDYTIERIDNDGNYEPSNCKWATRKEQSRNKSTSKKLTYNNETKVETDWANIFNMDRMTLKWRLSKNMSVEEALTTPIDLRFKLKTKKNELLLSL